MTLDQLHDLKRWHERHAHDQPLEKNVWDMVLTFWLSGWVGAPVALLVHAGWAFFVCAALLFLPSSYVVLRRRLHASRRLRCDWITTISSHSRRS
ncbi:MAG: hypothetical protein ABIZ18_03580 [Caldimonas sp.]